MSDVLRLSFRPGMGGVANLVAVDKDGMQIAGGMILKITAKGFYRYGSIVQVVKQHFDTDEQGSIALVDQGPFTTVQSSSPVPDHQLRFDIVAYGSGLLLRASLFPAEPTLPPRSGLLYISSKGLSVWKGVDSVLGLALDTGEHFHECGGLGLKEM